MPHKTKEFSPADIEAALNRGVAEGWLEGFEDGTYGLVPDERLTDEARALRAAHDARKEGWWVLPH